MNYIEGKNPKNAVNISLYDNYVPGERIKGNRITVLR